LGDVQSKRADYEAVLVYDVSRWGRFQDPDEAASIELTCKRAGIVVHYCAEQFENDGSMGSVIVKSVKRVMAGEYSRDLSVKVFRGQANLARHGFRQGGAAGFGLRRVLIDEHGNRKAELAAGEHKSIATDRVILVPGPNDEVGIVNEIYRAFIEEGKSEVEIATRLNARGILTDLRRPWTRGTIHQVLINEKYVGNNVWARTSFKLKQVHRNNPEGEWVRADRAFQAIVSEEIFRSARSIIDARSARLTDQEMLEVLAIIFKQRGLLTGLIIDEWEDAPSSSSYSARFGSLLRAYALVGFVPQHDYRYLEVNRALRRMHPAVLAETRAGLETVGGIVRQEAETDLLHINEEFTASIVIARCIETLAGALRWKVRLDTPLRPDLTVVVRMGRGNEITRDYYLLPHLDMYSAVVRLCEYNDLSFDAFRFDTLDRFFDMAKRSIFAKAA
jgi:DNA invertase Pin-like site-specific DNA recombinase